MSGSDKSVLQAFTFPYLQTKARHIRLGYEVELAVPANAQHRPAVKKFLKGKYYEPNSHLFFSKILAHKINKNVVHAGAFFGDMLDTLSRSAKTVFAFEPVFESFVFAKMNAAALGLSNVVLMNAALGDENAIRLMRIRNPSGQFLGGASQIANKTAIKSEAHEQVPVFRLDDLPIEKLGMLQLDIEGFEHEALQGGKELIRSSQPIILVEDNRQKCQTVLQELGYSFCFANSNVNYWAVAKDMDFLLSLAAPADKN